jgi:hypothetical protein
MHEQMARLYEAAEKIMGVTGQSAVARLLNVSPQNMNRWEARGVSAEGMIDAQELIGCSPLWVRSGIGPMVIGELFTAPPTNEGGGGLAESLKRSCETAAELQMLIVHRLSNQDGRMLIDDAVESARRELHWTGLVNKGE